jgi:NADH-quinone oxidoreductase subunit E
VKIYAKEIYMAETKIPQVDVEIRKWGAMPESLIQVLHGTQERIGYLPQESLHYIAEKLNIPLSKVYGVVTFYNFFKTEKNTGHVIMACMGTACYVKGGEGVIKALEGHLGSKVSEINSDGRFSLRIVRCLGACGLAPVISVDGKDIYGKLTPEEAVEAIKKYE